MTTLRTIQRLSRRDPAVAAVVRAWRRLAGVGRGGAAAPERRTLLACSGGADSSAMVLALASAVPRPAEVFVVGHVVHDLRPADEALPDRDAAAALAEALGLEFVEASVSVRGRGGNAEAVARRRRYAALDRLAAQRGCPFIATAHHADDQLETVLMGLVRGAGPRGLRGVAARRRLGADREPGAGRRVIRPMLGISRAECRRLCEQAGWAWREDRTNLDESRLRAALRHGVLPRLERLRPGAAPRAARAAALMRDAAGLVRDRARELWSQRQESGEGGQRLIAWPREALRRERAIVVGELLRGAAARLARGRGRDRLTARVVDPVVRAIRSRRTDPKVFAWPRARVHVSARRVWIERSRDGG